MATMIGTSGPDILIGTGAADTIFGRAGNDAITGKEGNDRLYGEAGSDRVVGGDGGDELLGGSGADLLLGDAGDDTILGGLGMDRAWGGAGADRIADFTRGQDKIGISHVTETDFSSSLDFGDLDSDGDGTLDAGDAFVAIERLSGQGGQAWSTVIDLGAAMEAVRGDDFFSQSPSVVEIFASPGCAARTSPSATASDGRLLVLGDRDGPLSPGRRSAAPSAGRRSPGCPAGRTPAARRAG